MSNKYLTVCTTEYGVFIVDLPRLARIWLVRDRKDPKHMIDGDKEA